MNNNETSIDGNVLFLYQEVKGNDDICIKIETFSTIYKGEKTLLIKLFGYGVDTTDNSFYEELKLERNFIGNSKETIKETIYSFLDFSNKTFRLSPTKHNDLINDYIDEMIKIYF